MFGKNANSALATRQAGVKVATNGPAGRGDPNTVVALEEAKVVFARYYDGNGRQQDGMFFKMGDTFYTTGDNEEWTKKLKPVTAWMKKALEQVEATKKPVSVPTDDVVDVTA